MAATAFPDFESWKATSTLGIDFSQARSAARQRVDAGKDSTLFKLSTAEVLAPNKKRTLTQFQPGKFSLSANPTTQPASIVAKPPPQEKLLSSKAPTLLSRDLLGRSEPFSLRLSTSENRPSAVVACNTRAPSLNASAPLKSTKLLTIGRNKDSVLAPLSTKTKKPLMLEHSGTPTALLVRRDGLLWLLKSHDYVHGAGSTNRALKSSDIQRSSSETPRKARVAAEYVACKVMLQNELSAICSHDDVAAGQAHT